LWRINEKVSVSITENRITFKQKSESQPEQRLENQTGEKPNDEKLHRDEINNGRNRVQLALGLQFV
jgi:hypothetical protein